MMTQTKKLEALFKKAIDNGWDGKTGGIEAVDTEAYYKLIDVGTYDVLFDHSFAKALWSDELIRNIFHPGEQIMSKGPIWLWKYQAVKEWQYHLQQAVISDDPVGYMYRVVFGKGKV